MGLKLRQLNTTLDILCVGMKTFSVNVLTELAEQTGGCVLTFTDGFASHFSYNLGHCLSRGFFLFF